MRSILVMYISVSPFQFSRVVGNVYSMKENFVNEENNFVNENEKETSKTRFAVLLQILL